MHFQLRSPSLPEQVSAERDDRLAGNLDADLALELLYALLLGSGFLRGLLRVSFHLLNVTHMPRH